MPHDIDIHKVAVWVRILNLPAKLYNKYFLWKVGKALGTMLKIDELTLIHSRGKFTRICVKIDLRKQIVPFFTALEKEFKLKYKGLHQVCFRCGQYGHRMKNCSEFVGEMLKQVFQTAMDGGWTPKHGGEDKNNSNLIGSSEKETP
ncbi:hypothetical protein AHAS_Ahas19G0316900 [Arachis hypogaea]